MPDTYMEYRDETGTVARWHGGAYIDIGYMEDQGANGIDGDNFHAYDVINVWDYEKGEPSIPRTLEAFEEAVEEKIRELAKEEA